MRKKKLCGFLHSANLARFRVFKNPASLKAFDVYEERMCLSYIFEADIYDLEICEQMGQLYLYIVFFCLSLEMKCRGSY